MASIAFLLILVRVGVIRKSFCDSRIVGVFEEDEPREEGRGRSSDHLIPDPKLTGSRCFNSIWESERRRNLPCRHICNRTGFQSSLPAWLWQAPQSPPSMTESAALREERPVRACTPTHVCPADSQQDPWKTRTFSYPLTDWKKKKIKGCHLRRKGIWNSTLASCRKRCTPCFVLAGVQFSTQRDLSFY